jgi:hypothetical protein
LWSFWRDKGPPGVAMAVPEADLRGFVDNRGSGLIGRVEGFPEK